MNTLSRAALITAVLALAACASISLPLQSSFSHFREHTRDAMEVYNAGSSFAGSGTSLLFVDNARWEQWNMSCTETSRAAHGTYRKNEDHVTLYQKNKVPVTLYQYSLGWNHLLLTSDELQRIKSDPDHVSMEILFKKSK